MPESGRTSIPKQVALLVIDECNKLSLTVNTDYLWIAGHFIIQVVLFLVAANLRLLKDPLGKLYLVHIRALISLYQTPTNAHTYY
jgi:hypothetical protein